MDAIGQEDVETAMHKTKRQGGRGRRSAARDDGDQMAGEVGVKWTGRLLKVCRCRREGHRSHKEWRMGMIVPIW